MDKDSAILIRNIYVMLAYAFRDLRGEHYERVAAEPFEHIEDLFAALLVKGVTQQLKQGLHKSYREHVGDGPTLRGRLVLRESMKHRMAHRPVLTSAYDMLSADHLFHQIIKATLTQLIRSPQVAPARKSECQKLRLVFEEVSDLSADQIPWRKLQYRRSNRGYELLMEWCAFVLQGMLPNEENGARQMRRFSDASLARLYERFLLAYYRNHHPELDEVRSAAIHWAIDSESDPRMMPFLPGMQSDVFLRKGDRVLIIDAKFYGRTLQRYYDKQSLHSANLYQIFTYVKNHDAKRTGRVAGLLLYAKTEESVVPDVCYQMSGNLIGATTLDLNRPFSEIAKALDAIVERYLAPRETPAEIE